MVAVGCRQHIIGGKGRVWEPMRLGKGTENLAEDNRLLIGLSGNTMLWDGCKKVSSRLRKSVKLDEGREIMR